MDRLTFIAFSVVISLGCESTQNLGPIGDGGDDVADVRGTDARPDDGCVAELWYEDDDGDGHGNPPLVKSACAPLVGYARIADDCDAVASNGCEANLLTSSFDYGGCSRRRAGNCRGGVCMTSGGTPAEVAAGSGHTCARRSSGSVVCWGWNDFGQLGDGTTTYSLAPVTVSGLSDAVQVAARGEHTCARRISAMARPRTGTRR